MSGIVAEVVTRYEGGLLELRERASERVLARIPNTIPGDALIVRLDARSSIARRR